MRVTNNMIMKSANTNINGTKVQVDKTNNQMTVKATRQPNSNVLFIARAVKTTNLIVNTKDRGC